MTKYTTQSNSGLFYTLKVSFNWNSLGNEKINQTIYIFILYITKILIFLKSLIIPCYVKLYFIHYKAHVANATNLINFLTFITFSIINFLNESLEIAMF